MLLAHCGDALPMLSSGLKPLSTQPWVPNANNITQEEAHVQLAKSCLDTAATAPTGIAPALLMMPPEQLVYCTNCGVQSPTEPILKVNKQAVLDYEALS